MKKIIFFSKNLNIGGMEKALVALINSLVNYYDVTLVLEEKKGKLLLDVDKRIEIKEYKLSVNKNVFLRKGINLFNRLKWRIKYHNKFDFSCNFATYSYIGSKLAHISSKNSSLYIHSDYYNLYKKDSNKIKNFFKNHKLNKFKKLIFVSKESERNFLKIFNKYNNKSIVINNLIDYDQVRRYSLETLDFEINKKMKNFIFIGRLDNSSKNIDLLLKSINLAYNIDNNIHLFIIGDGPYKNDIITYVKNNNLDNCITIINETTNPYKYLRNCDCLVLTSNYEGFPVVYLEALVLNKQIMTTILTSDSEIKIEDYCIFLKKDVNMICNELVNYKKAKRINYKIDFKKMNDNKINEIRKIIGD